MRAAVISLAALGLTAGGAYAAPPPPCSVQRGLDTARLDVIQREGELATAAVPLLDEMGKLSDKAPDPKRPVGEQLDWRDVARLQELSTEFKAGRLADYVLSGRDRDLEIAQEMLNAANAQHGGTPVADADAEGGALLVWMQQTFEGPLVVEEPPERNACGLDTLLHAEAAAATDPQYQRNLTSIRYWLWASGEVFATRELDLANYPGDISKIGTEIQRRLPTYSERDKQLIGVWTAVDRTYRSRASLEIEEDAKAETPGK